MAKASKFTEVSVILSMTNPEASAVMVALIYAQGSMTSRGDAETRAGIEEVRRALSKARVE